MRVLILAAITFYQRYLSPYKGFCCAYRQHTRRQSCSQLGFRAIRRYGVISGLGILRQRTQLCGEVYKRHAPLYKRPLRAQRGDCDFPCDLDLIGCCDVGSCDWPDKRRTKKSKERYIYIPPKVHK